MKILHIIPTLSSMYGGPAKFCKELSAFQVKSGDDVTICTSNRGHPWSTIIDYPTNTPFEKDGVIIFYFRSYLPLLFSLELIKWFKKNATSFDIIHIHGIYRFPNTFAAWYARHINKPYIIRPHGSLDPFLYKQSKYNMLFKRIYERLFEIRNLNKANAIHYTTDDEKELASFLRLRSLAFVVPNGLNLALYENLPAKGQFRLSIGLADNIPLILFLGRINFKKGLDILLNAFTKIIKNIPEAKLVIAGSDSDGYLKIVKKISYENKIESNIIFVGHLTDAETISAFVDADLFVLTSYTENFGMSVIEAMASGCPVLISNKVNIHNAVEKSKAGIVVNLNVDEIQTAMEKTLNDADILKRYGTEGRIFVKENYGMEKIASLLKDQYVIIIQKQKENINGVQITNDE